MTDERRRPYVNQVEHLALVKEYNAQPVPRRQNNAAYLLGFHAYVDRVVAKRALEKDQRD